jgi:hypothetical protein
MVWREVKKDVYVKLTNMVLYKAMAGGTMLNGGKYTEYCPNWRTEYPDLRVETSPDFKQHRYFVWSE